VIKVDVRADTDVLDAIREAAQDAPRRMRKAFKRVVKRTRQHMLDDLRDQPGRPHYPLRWKSDRQRRYVMAKLRREGNLPYQRAGRLSAGWTTHIRDQKDGAVFEVVNNVPYARFVQGDDTQPYHLDTGWPQAAKVTVKYRDILINDLIDAWGSVALGEG